MIKQEFKTGFDTSFALKELFEEVKELLTPYAKNKRLQFTCKTDEASSQLKLQGEPDMLKQIAMSLLSNAIRFTLKGKVELLVTHKKNGVKNVDLHISVKDTGIGISESDMENIFKTILEGDENYNRLKTASVGFSLPLCKQMIKMLNGEIIATSVLGAGSEFKVIIPFHPVTDTSVAGNEIPLVVNDYSGTEKTEVFAGEEMSLAEAISKSLSVKVPGFSLDQLNKMGDNDEEFLTIMLERFINTASANTENMVLGISTRDPKKLMNAAHKSIASFLIFGLTDLVQHLRYIELHSRQGVDVSELSASVQLVHEQTWKVISGLRSCLDIIKDKKAEATSSY